MTKSLKFGNVIVCEYASKGERNKFTLVNIFSGDIIVAEFPANLHLGLYLEYYPDFEGESDLSLDINLDEDTLATMTAQTKDAIPGTSGVIIIPAIQLGIERDLTLNVVASKKGYKKVTVVSKRIYKGNFS